MTAIEHFLNNDSLLKFIQKYSGRNWNYSKDLYQDLCLKILEMDQEALSAIIATGNIQNYFIGMIVNEIKNPENNYFKTYICKPDYKTYKSELDFRNMDDIDWTDEIQEINNFLNSPHNLTEWVQNSILLKYAECGTYAKVEQAIEHVKTQRSIRYCVTLAKQRYFAKRKKNNL